MILAAIDWLTISIDLLIGVFVLVCLIMSLIILMQRPKNEGLGAAFGSSTTDQLFGARTTNVLQRGTIYFATLFFVLALVLAILVGQRNKRDKSFVEDVNEPAAEVTVVESPETPSDQPEEQPAQESPETAAEDKPLEPEPVVNPEPADPAPVDPAPVEETAPEETPAQQDEAPPAEETPGEEP